MSTTAPATPRSATTPKQQFLDSYQAEADKTLRVLRAYPKDKTELKPHPRAKNARELAFMFVAEQGAIAKTLTDGFDWSKPMQFPPTPESLDEIVAAFEEGNRKVIELVRGVPEEKILGETIQFPVGPGKMGDVPKMQALWMFLCDQIHHRGQFSVYLRMADGKVPSIYGPSADEPWR
jgi:uncharacterized damage-inducible protein DinB